MTSVPRPLVTFWRLVVTSDVQFGNSTNIWSERIDSRWL